MSDQQIRDSLKIMTLALETGEYSLVRNGKWLGDNLHYYREGWPGNQYAGSRNFTFRTSHTFGVGAYALGSITAVANGYEAGQQFSNADYLAGGTAFGHSAIALGTTFGGLPGLAIGLAYLAFEGTGARPALSDWLGEKMTAFSEYKPHNPYVGDLPLDDSRGAVSNNRGAAVGWLPKSRRR